jgi:hypothetical protein
VQLSEQGCVAVAIRRNVGNLAAGQSWNHEYGKTCPGKQFAALRFVLVHRSLLQPSIFFLHNHVEHVERAGTRNTS